jgi:hypothetical protein
LENATIIIIIIAITTITIITLIALRTIVKPKWTRGSNLIKLK